jgi:monofunctional chorismate mutase
MDLDLQNSIRPGLDILANEIIISLKKRTRFAKNAEVYAAGLVDGEPDTSLLQYELARVEQVHAELGRFKFADQEPYTSIDDIESIILRSTPASPIEPMRSGVGGRIVEFYGNWIRTACADGSNQDTFGETVTADVSALLAIMERINLGKYVAESKFADAPEKFLEAAGEREATLELIVRRNREGQVFELARNLARHYDFDEDQAVAVFEFMVEVTKDVEVDYIRQRLGLR